MKKLFNKKIIVSFKTINNKNINLSDNRQIRQDNRNQYLKKLFFSKFCLKNKKNTKTKKEKIDDFDIKGTKEKEYCALLGILNLLGVNFLVLVEKVILVETLENHDIYETK